MVFSYHLIKTLPSPPHLLQITCNHYKLYSMNGRSSEEQLFAGPREHLSRSDVITYAANFGGFSLNSVFKKCETCGGQGAIECPGCKGTGKNKKNGNIFERWKCFECQGFGLKSCPVCGKGGLTPEQRGER